MYALFVITAFCIATASSYAQPSPAVLPSVVIEETGSRTCPAADDIDQARSNAMSEIRSILSDTVIPELDGRPPCSCGGEGRWIKVASLNMTDPSQNCPLGWSLISTPERGCQRPSTMNCASAIFLSNGQSYSHVCGRIIAYQKGSSDAFQGALTLAQSLDGSYIDGISLTHGAPGSRQHIWSFAGALYENNPNYRADLNCACTNIDELWPFQVPSFVGDDYFCDTPNPGPSISNSTIYTDDPLWDGSGCGPTNACCTFNNPPWFCTTLPQPTADDLEVRICNTDGIAEENTVISLIDINVM